MATIHDVAKHAGVSVATASRALSGRGYVSAASRDQVLKAAAALNYLPNGMARGLKTQRSGLIALLVPEIVNTFYTTISRGVEDVANANGLQVILGNTDESVAKERAYVELMITTRVDGVIVAPAGRTAEHLLPLLTASVPTVLIDRMVDGFPADTVRGDSVGGAETLTRHLIALGHRRIALLNGNLDTSVAREREAGFRAEHERAGLGVDEQLVSSGSWFIDDAAARAANMLASANPPTAIVATNNFMAIGALRALRQRGLRVPEDVALVSFDDIADAAEINPFLTALSQPAYDMGAIAMRLLQERIAGSYTDLPRELELEPRLLVRRSCGAGITTMVGADPAASAAAGTAEEESAAAPKSSR